MFVKPKPGVLLRDPLSKELLPPGGRNVEASGFWLRRIAEGAVEIVSPPAPALKPAPATHHVDLPTPRPAKDAKK